ncbi:MAG: hypothetical protein FT726_09375 [Pantoea sp. Morm]|nr:hypothetical protein [Pantoea sp. Morm]NIG16276.1 hypothetical protein [Pantoea sp. Cy-640]
MKSMLLSGKPPITCTLSPCMNRDIAVLLWMKGAPLWCRDLHKAGRPAEQTGADAQAARAAGAD